MSTTTSSPGACPAGAAPPASHTFAALAGLPAAPSTGPLRAAADQVADSGMVMMR